MSTVFATLASDETPTTPYTPLNVQFVDDNGQPVTIGGGSTYTLPAASQNALGGVKMQVFGNAIGNAVTNVAAAAGDNPTKTEYNALVAAYNALAGQFNRLISGLASSGVIQVPAAKE